MDKEIKSVDECISNFPLEVKQRLEKIRKIIKEIAPAASEQISYGMPAYKLNKKPLADFWSIFKAYWILRNSGST